MSDLQVEEKKLKRKTNTRKHLIDASESKNVDAVKQEISVIATFCALKLFSILDFVNKAY